MVNTTSSMSNYITQIRSTLASIDDSARAIGGLYWQATRLCEFEDAGENGWQPVVVDPSSGSLAMLVTDDDLIAMNFTDFTAQELGTAFFGAVNTMIGLSTPLADLIGKVRA